MARPERFELPTNWFEASYSIQLSYGRFSYEMVEIDTIFNSAEFYQIFDNKSYLFATTHRQMHGPSAWCCVCRINRCPQGCGHRAPGMGLRCVYTTYTTSSAD